MTCNEFTSRASSRAALSLLAVTGALASFAAYAARDLMIEARLEEVVVNGGGDTFNPGATCIKISADLSPAQCKGGWIYIPGNNKLLVSAALAAKAGTASSRLYLDTEAIEEHCPGYIFTPCQVASIALR